MKKHPIQDLIDRQKAAGERAGHIVSFKSEPPMSDSCSCSCGWKSQTYYDGAEFAFNDWVKHAIANGVEMPTDVR